MPQLFQVLRCYKCLMFQVHQTKKSNKFQCKVCGEKQSIKRHYGLGNGQECRKHVQKLNAIRGEVDELKNGSDNNSDTENDLTNKPIAYNTLNTAKEIGNNSKWSDFVEEEQSDSLKNESDDTLFFNDKEVVLELPKKRKKTLGSFRKNHKKNLCNMNYSDSEIDNVAESPSPHSHDLQTSENMSNHKFNQYKQSIFKYRPPLLTDVKLETNYSEKVNENYLPNDHSKDLDTEDNLLPSYSIEQESNSGKEFHNKTQVKKIVPPLINKNSKWAKFAEEDEEENITMSYEEEESEMESMDRHGNTIIAGSQASLLSVDSSEVNLSKKGTQKLFSLCDDDDDLDKYLNI